MTNTLQALAGRVEAGSVTDKFKAMRRAQLVLDAIAMRNTYGLSADNQIALDVQHEQARINAQFTEHEYHEAVRALAAQHDRQDGE